MKRWLQLLLSVSLLFPAAAFAGLAKTQARLILSAETARPGDLIWTGIEMKMPAMWHTYWQNAGDSGIPTSVQWTLPTGIEAGAIQWPIPEKLVTGMGDVSLITYNYSDEVVLLVPLKIAANLQPGPIQLQALIKWQECSDVCVQGSSTQKATLTIGNETKPSADASLIEEWKKKWPRTDSALKAKASWAESGDAESRPVVIEWQTGETNADFFPYESKNFEVSGATTVLRADGGNIRLRKIVKKSEGDWPKSLSGILVTKPNSADTTGFEVTLPIGDSAAASVQTTNGGSTNPVASASLFTMLLFALIGGLILNIMPCVLPVIALKVLGFVNQAKETPQRVRTLGLIYGGGVLVSFLVLAGLAIGAQQASGLGNWGGAIRNPQFRVILTVLITLVALNLFGLFEVTLSGRALGTAGDLASKQGAPGAFFNGVLATILATPCTAPFLAPALGFALTQPPTIVVLIFLCVGIGLALPFVVICFQPRLLKFLPKPGAWMEKFKIAMGFPMLATAMWLFWVTSTRMGKSGVLWFGIFLVMLAFAAWIWGEFVQRGTKRRGVATVSALLILLLGYTYILEGKLSWRSPQTAQKEKIEWQKWSQAAVEKARRDGHPVLVDFTADTCLNCQINKLTSIEIASTISKLKEIGAETFIGDYTDEDPAIGKELQRYGRTGVPLVLVFSKDVNRPATVLPPVLTPKIVLDALDAAK